MSNTIDDFTNFFKPNKAKEYFNVSDSVNESLTLLEKIINAEMIDVSIDFDDAKVLGISNELTQVIINLIKNAKDAFVQNSILIREINISIVKEGEYGIIKVQDNAGGIKAQELYKIFEPYYTTKHMSQGTGLGLFMSKMICEQGLNGSLSVESQKNITTFRIKIPIEASHES